MNSAFGRRSFLAGTACAVSSLTACARGRRPMQCDRTDDRPNLVLFVADDQRWDAMGCAGNPAIQTPAMDALAARGVRFSNNFCTTPLCHSSRASIYTGLYAGRHGIEGAGQRLSTDHEAGTYFNQLREAGYHTGFIGKLHLGNADEIASQFDYWAGMYDPDYYRMNAPDGHQPLHLTRLFGMNALEFLATRPTDKPFCLTVNFKAPHVGKDLRPDGTTEWFGYDPDLEDLYADTDMPVPASATEADFRALPDFTQNSVMRERWQQRFSTPDLFQESVRNHHRLVTGMDRAIGVVSMALDRCGLTESTVVIHTSDNGFFLGEKGLAAKHLIYEEAIRTPLIIADPALPAERRGTVCDAMALNIDLAPTMLAYAGVVSSMPMDGRSLVPLVKQGDADWREDWFFEHRMDLDGFPKSEGVRSDQWAYARYIETIPAHEELFHLPGDPLQRNNLAADPAHRAVLDHMRARWAEYRREVVGRPLP